MSDTANLTISNSSIDIDNSVTVPRDNWNKPFWRSVFSGSDGDGSTSRVGSLSIIWTTLSIASYLAIKNNNIPEHLMTLGLFSALMITTVYSPAKIADIFQAYFVKK
jgi:hypothetical protein